MADRPTGGAPASGTPGSPGTPERPNRPQDDRRARIEELKRSKKRKDRAKAGMFLAVVLIGMTAIFGRQAYGWLDDKINDPLKRSISSFGVPEGEAECGEPTDDEASGNQKHVQGVRVDYDKIPPSSGEHYSNPVLFTASPFFNEKDRPPVENLVHNMEHGYTILWFDPALTEDEQDEIKGLAERLRNDGKYQQFIAVAWDNSYGEFPKKKRVALSHWSGDGSGVKNDASVGHRMLCEQLSGDAVKGFMDAYPATDAPERNIR